MPSRLTDIITVSVGFAVRKSKMWFTISRKYFRPANDTGKALCTNINPSWLTSPELSGWTLISRNRTPLLSCSFTDTA